MGLAQSTGEYLRSLGHDAVHLRDEGLQRLPDERIVIKAQDEGRTIITHDLDFGRIVALSGDTVPSIVTLRLTET
jgi:predicted nuclease of predicted toxin-antitoxin system